MSCNLPLHLLNLSQQPNMIPLKNIIKHLPRVNSVISLNSLIPIVPLSQKQPSIFIFPFTKQKTSSACFNPSSAVRTHRKLKHFCNMAASNSDQHKHEHVAVKDDRISRISSTIRVIPDFPKPGKLTKI